MFIRLNSSSSPGCFLILDTVWSGMNQDLPPSSQMLLFPQFLSEVEAWCKVCSEGGLPSEMQELELAIHRHQSLYEQVTQAYTEVQRQQPDGPVAR